MCIFDKKSFYKRGKTKKEKVFKSVLATASFITMTYFGYKNCGLYSAISFSAQTF